MIKQATYPLSAFQIAHLSVNPVEVLPAPGVGKVLMPIYCAVNFTPGTTPVIGVSGVLTAAYTGIDVLALTQADPPDTAGNPLFNGPSRQHLMIVGTGNGSGSIVNENAENVGISISYTGDFVDLGPITSVGIGNPAGGDPVTPHMPGRVVKVSGGDGLATVRVDSIAVAPATIVAVTDGFPFPNWISLTIDGGDHSAWANQFPLVTGPADCTGGGNIFFVNATNFDSGSNTTSFQCDKNPFGSGVPAIGDKLAPCKQPDSSPNVETGITLLTDGNMYQAVDNQPVIGQGQDPGNLLTINILSITPDPPADIGTATVTIGYLELSI